MSATPGYFLCALISLGVGVSAASTITEGAAAQRRAYYGDLHLHTGFSFDAYLTGTRIGPDDAYRFARGEIVTIDGVPKKRTSAPLDFLAVTDHAEWMNSPEAWQSPHSPPFLHEIYRRFSTALNESFQAYLQLNWPTHPKLPSGVSMDAVERSAWLRQVDAANRQYRPGEFTTLLGYEWTSERMVEGKVLALHRNVIFAGHNPPVPFTSIDSDRPEDLWRFLDQCRTQGHEVLAIAGHPHRSQGTMFDVTDSDGRFINASYAQDRVVNERLLEIMVGSGDSEADPEFSPDDEFAAFDRAVPRTGSASHKPQRGGYARYALTEGMRLAQSNGGVNPYRFGFVASSDFHHGLSDSAESVAARRSSGGLTGVWAQSNTREAIFAALQRRETFATSGTRLQLRFFGGWSYDESLLDKSDWLERAYSDGVPMGGDLPVRRNGQRAPIFIAQAHSEPNGANLDRLQIVKVWLEGGQHAEKIYNVVLAAGREDRRAFGQTSAIRSTVDLATASYTNTVGAPMLAALWRDPDFDPTQPAAYYLRALEIPTPRMTTYLAQRKGVALSQEWPGVIQERGWASPIWYSPRRAGERWEDTDRSSGTTGARPNRAHAPGAH
jgi:hypothetical protein